MHMYVHMKMHLCMHMCMHMISHNQTGVRVLHEWSRVTNKRVTYKRVMSQKSRVTSHESKRTESFIFFLTVVFTY